MKVTMDKRKNAKREDMERVYGVKSQLPMLHQHVACIRMFVRYWWTSASFCPTTLWRYFGGRKPSALPTWIHACIRMRSVDLPLRQRTRWTCIFLTQAMCIVESAKAAAPWEKVTHLFAKERQSVFEA